MNYKIRQAILLCRGLGDILYWNTTKISLGGQTDHDK